MQNATSLYDMPPPETEEELRTLMREVPQATAGFTDLRLLPPREAQRFVNYLGSRWRTLGFYWFTREFTSDDARQVYAIQARNEIVSYPGVILFYLGLRADACARQYEAYIF